MGTTTRFDDLRTAYLASRRVAPNTRRLYGAALKRYAEWAATKRLDPLELTVPQVLGFIEYAQRGRSAMYATKLVGITSNFFGWLFTEGHISSDPWASAQKPPYVRELRDALSLDERVVCCARTAAHPTEQS